MVSFNLSLRNNSETDIVHLSKVRCWRFISSQKFQFKFFVFSYLCITFWKSTYIYILNFSWRMFLFVRTFRSFLGYVSAREVSILFTNLCKIHNESIHIRQFYFSKALVEKAFVGKVLGNLPCNKVDGNIAVILSSIFCF